MIGDADDGYVVRLAPEPGFSPHGSLIATGAVLFDRPDLAAKAGAIDSKTVTLLGVQAVRRFAQLQATRAARLPSAPAVLRIRLLPAGHGVRHARRGAAAGRCGSARLPEPRRARPRRCAVVHAERRRPRDPGRPGHVCVSHRSGMAALLPQHARAQHRRRRRAGPVGAGRQFHVDRPRARALHRIRLRLRARSASSANTTATSGSRIRWCTGAKSCSIRTSRSSTSTDMLRCEARARRAPHLAFRRRLPGRDASAQDLHVSSRPHAGDHAAAGSSSSASTIHRGGSAEQGGWISRRFGHKEPCTTVVWKSRISGATVLRTRITYTRSRSVGV